MARPPRTLDEVTRSIERTLIPQREQDSQDPGTELPIRSGEASDEERSQDTDRTRENERVRDPARLRDNEAVRPLSEVYTKAANDIQNTGQAVMQVASEIAAQTKALADLIRKHGESIAERIDEFTSMTKQVADAVQRGRGQVGSGEGTRTPLVPRS